MKSPLDLRNFNHKSIRSLKEIHTSYQTRLTHERLPRAFIFQIEYFATTRTNWVTGNTCASNIYFRVMCENSWDLQWKHHLMIHLFIQLKHFYQFKILEMSNGALIRWLDHTARVVVNFYWTKETTNTAVFGILAHPIVEKMFYLQYHGDNFLQKLFVIAKLFFKYLSRLFNLFLNSSDISKCIMGVSDWVESDRTPKCNVRKSDAFVWRFRLILFTIWVFASEVSDFLTVRVWHFSDGPLQLTTLLEMKNLEKWHYWGLGSSEGSVRA